MPPTSERSSKKICPECSQTFDAQDRNFCPHDGAELRKHNDVSNEQYVCPECEGAYTEEFQFCPEDGTKLVAQEQLIPTCPECGREFTEDRSGKYCPHDGAQIKPRYKHSSSSSKPSSQTSRADSPKNRGGSSERIEPHSPPKSKGLAAFLSFFIVGVGQMYLGQVGKGFVLFIAAGVIGAATMGIAAIPILIIACIDAYQIGDKLESGQPVGKWEWF